MLIECLKAYFPIPFVHFKAYVPKSINLQFLNLYEVYDKYGLKRGLVRMMVEGNCACHDSLVGNVFA